MVKILYGKSDFKALITKGYYYIDRTSHIEQIERSNASSLFFLRPRRFGKSLFVSTLKYYYGVEYKGEFQTLFGQCYIGKYPTPNANSYLVLHFNFSSIAGKTPEELAKNFNTKVQNNIQRFLSAYIPLYFSEEAYDILEGKPDANILLERLFALIDKSRKSIPPLYVLIDEYDHFSSTLLANSEEAFLEVVSSTGFFRKFFEALKIGTESLIKRIFATGVSPITLDGFTSGFNIAADISRNKLYHDLMGFKSEEVKTLFSDIGIGEEELPALMKDIQFWYNGYSFHPKVKTRLYNPDMVLYFAKEYIEQGEYPEELLDTNISSDYGKLRSILQLGNNEEVHIQTIQTLLNEGYFLAKLTQQFNFERPFSIDDFVSLLYYMGLLSLTGKVHSLLSFRIPNQVIKALYFDFLREFIDARTKSKVDLRDLNNALIHLSEDNNIRSILALAEERLQHMSNRDAIQFDEKHLKTLLFSLLYPSPIYHIHSEYEVARKYIDLFLEGRRDAEVKYQFVFELKYLSKANEKKLEEVKAEAIAQLRGYMAHESLAKLSDLVGYVIIFVGTEAKVVEKLL